MTSKNEELLPPPTTEYRKVPSAPSAWFFPTLMAVAFAAGGCFGYTWPRDVELESTAPVELHYQITTEAARLLVFKGVTGCAKTEGVNDAIN